MVFWYLYANSEGSGKPRHQSRLTRAFLAHIVGILMKAQASLGFIAGSPEPFFCTHDGDINEGSDQNLGLQLHLIAVHAYI